MKKTLRCAVFVLCLILLFPHIWNLCIRNCFEVSTMLIPISDWNATIPPIISAFMSLLVIFQAETQRESSETAQARMEKINDKMLTVERKEKLGYFIPEVSEDFDTLRKNSKIHPLEKYIYLRNSGNDGVFVEVKDLSVCGAKKSIPHRDPLWFSCTEPFCTMDFECYLTSEELNRSELDISITLLLTNMVGYKYLQELEIGFHNRNGLGVVSSYNMRLLEATDNAD